MIPFLVPFSSSSSSAYPLQSYSSPPLHPLPTHKKEKEKVEEEEEEEEKRLLQQYKESVVLFPIIPLYQ